MNRNPHAVTSRLAELARRAFARSMPAALALVCGLGLAAQAAETGLGPQEDPPDPAVWPNTLSRANSDLWLADHHGKIRQMRPRLLVLNFSNQAKPEKQQQMVRDLIATLAEASRYHGYADSNAPAFLSYQVLKFVDLRDAGSSRSPNADRTPVKKTTIPGPNFDYQQLFNERFAEYYGIRDPDRTNRWLRLSELVDRGYVHEVWFFAEQTKELVPLESVELKAVYDEAFHRQTGRYIQAGNAGDPSLPWAGRSLRIGFINASRGIGCFLESLGHSLESMADSRVIPYFTRYFHEFAGFDLDRRWRLPWDSFYPLTDEEGGIEYPDPNTAVVRYRTLRMKLAHYATAGGNVDFPPNARKHSDIDNPDPVMSTIEDWHIGSGPNGQDVAKPWSNAAFARYREMAPDCTGAWLVYWRQNFPGLDNRQKDANGMPMLNWWPFLFY